MTDEEKAANEAKVAQAKLDQEAEVKRIDGLEKADLVKEVAKLNQESAGRRVANKELQDQIDAAKVLTDKAALEAAEKNGEFEELYKGQKSEVETATGKVATMTAALQKVLDAEVALIPENMRALVPAGDVSAALEWIAAAKAAKVFETPGGPGVKVPGEETKNSITRQAFDALSPTAQQKHIVEGGKVHD